MGNDTKAHDHNGPFHGIVRGSNSFPLNEAPAPPINNYNFGAPAGTSFAEHQFWPIAAEDFAFQYPSSTVGADEIFRASNQWLQPVCTAHPLSLGIATDILLTMQHK
jgi:hypothetical protein